MILPLIHGNRVSPLQNPDVKGSNGTCGAFKNAEYINQGKEGTVSGSLHPPGTLDVALREPKIVS